MLAKTVKKLTLLELCNYAACKLNKQGDNI